MLKLGILQGITITPVSTQFSSRENKNIRKIHRELAAMFQKIIFQEICSKSFSQGFLTFRFSKDCSKTKKLSFYRPPNFSEDFNTTLVNVRFGFRSAAESIAQDSTLLTGCHFVRCVLCDFGFGTNWVAS